MRLGTSLRTALLVMIAFMSINVLRAQSKQDLKKEFDALELQMDKIYEKYNIDDATAADIDENIQDELKLTDKEMKELEKAMNEKYDEVDETIEINEKDVLAFEKELANISDEDLKAIDVETEDQMFHEFVESYEEHTSGKNLDQIIATISQDEKEGLKSGTSPEEKKAVKLMFQMERELARVEHKMYVVAKKYIAKK